MQTSGEPQDNWPVNWKNKVQKKKERKKVITIFLKEITKCSWGVNPFGVLELKIQTGGGPGFYHINIVSRKKHISEFCITFTPLTA